jgi:hypothetical protein
LRASGAARTSQRPLLFRFRRRPRDHSAIVVQFEDSLGSFDREEGLNGDPPGLNPIGQRAGLPDSRHHDRGSNGLTGKKVFILCEEDQLAVVQSLADSSVRGAAPSEGE